MRKFFLIIILIVLYISSLKTRGGFSFFSDKEEIVQNTIAAGVWIDTSTPTLHLVINEIYYDPDTTHKHPSSADERDFEWVELYNPTNGTVNLKDWKIIDNSGTQRTISTSNRNLAPGQFAILAKAANVFTLWTIPDSAEIIPLGERFGDGLANVGDQVILKDDQGNIIDQMSYGNDSTILDPSATDVIEGHSLERDPDGVDTDTAADFVNRSIPTPGS